MSAVPIGSLGVLMTSRSALAAMLVRPHARDTDLRGVDPGIPGGRRPYRRLTGIMLAAALITLVGVLAWVWRSPCVMAGCSATRQAAFAPEQNHDEQAESDQGRKAGGLEQTTDGKGVETACGVETVAHQPDMIGPAADAASTGIDQREPQIGRIEPDAGQGARNAAVRRHHEGGCRMRVAASVAIVDRVKAEGRRQRYDIDSVGAQQVRIVALLGERDREILGLLQRDMRRAAAALPGRS